MDECGRTSVAAPLPAGRFIAAAAFTGDVKIWEVQRSKQGAPVGVDAKNAVMLLKGHSSAVMWVGPGEYCLPRHPHLKPSLLELMGIL